MSRPWVKEFRNIISRQQEALIGESDMAIRTRCSLCDTRDLPQGCKRCGFGLPVCADCIATDEWLRCSFSINRRRTFLTNWPAMSAAACFVLRMCRQREGGKGKKVGVAPRLPAILRGRSSGIRHVSGGMAGERLKKPLFRARAKLQGGHLRIFITLTGKTLAILWSILIHGLSPNFRSEEVWQNT